MSGFGNSFETEVLAGALPIGRNSPQRVKDGLYPEQLSGSPFTAPQNTNQRSWLYRIRPTVKHSARYRRVDKEFMRTAPAAREESDLPIGQLRWGPDRKSTRLNSSHLGISYALELPPFPTRRSSDLRPLSRAAVRLAVHRAAEHEPALLALPHPTHGQALGALPQGRQGVHAHCACGAGGERPADRPAALGTRSEEHTSELQSLRHLVCPRTPPFPYTTLFRSSASIPSSCPARRSPRRRTRTSAPGSTASDPRSSTRRATAGSTRSSCALRLRRGRRATCRSASCVGDQIGRAHV